MGKVTAPPDVGDGTQDAPSVVASSIRVLRRRKGLTLATLAEKTNLDKGYLSRIERGQKSPSIGTLLKIAEALDVQVGHLFGETTANSITIVRHNENIDVSAIPGAPLTQAILPASGGRRISAFLFEPGTERESRHTEHPGDELLYVLQGSVEVIFSDRVVQLDAGDCIHFDGHLRHQVRRVGKKTPRVLLIVTQDPASPANGID
jgi:transcriptional regulator with XRE-family HTH domain